MSNKREIALVLRLVESDQYDARIRPNFPSKKLLFMVHHFYIFLFIIRFIYLFTYLFTHLFYYLGGPTMIQLGFTVLTIEDLQIEDMVRRSNDQTLSLAKQSNIVWLKHSRFCFTSNV